MSESSAPLTRIVKGGLLTIWIGAMVIALAAWMLPLEVAQNWAVGRARNDEFSQFEALHASTAAVWFVRWFTSTCAAVLSFAWIFRRRVIPGLVKVLSEFWRSAAPDVGGQGQRSCLNVIRIGAVRLFIVAWLGLAIFHEGFSIQRRLWDWPVYRLLAGPIVLPNISETNREVIRYLSANTPAGSRILIVSDQKLFFLSYYLLPRRLYHPTHPDSEFVIPQPYNQRQLAAYRLQDLSPDRIDRLKPDYILEYFEGSTYTQGEDLYQDSTWVEFEQHRHGAKWHPQFLVALRQSSTGGRP